MNLKNEIDHEPPGEQTDLPFDPPLEERAPAEPSETDALRAQCAELNLRLIQLQVRDDLTAELRSAGAQPPKTPSSLVTTARHRIPRRLSPK